MSDVPEITHDRAQQRFSAVVDSNQCVLDYAVAEPDASAPENKRMTITHTLVPEAAGGRGVAAALVKAAVEHAREQGWKVVPACSYAAAWLRKHPEYEDVRV